MFRKAIVTSSLFGLIFCTGLFAFAPAGSAQSIEVEHYGSIPYVSGGVGLDEREELEAMANNYNLKLLFAVPQGNYLSSVNVLISRDGNRVLDAVSNGPWFFAQLPPGTYRISAATLGKTITKTVQVGSRAHTQLSFVWSGP